jgi:hypothetical protein
MIASPQDYEKARKKFENEVESGFFNVATSVRGKRERERERESESNL